MICPLKKGCCLLYTSDAADERSSVDLGGRRIIKKKKTVEITVTTQTDTNTEQQRQINIKHTSTKHHI